MIPAWGDYAGLSLARAVRSVRAQDGTCRVLVVDNANRPPIRKAKGSDVVRLEKRVTVGAARNAGLAKVDTDYVLFLDADDKLRTDVVPKMVAVLDRHPDAVAVTTKLVAKSGESFRWPHDWMRTMQRHTPPVFQAAEMWRPCFPVQATLVRTDVATLSPGYDADASAAEDWVFGVSLALRGKIALLDEPGIVYEPQPDGLWSRQAGWYAHRHHCAAVRRRLRDDPATPPLVKAALPGLRLAHELDGVRRAITR